VLGVISVRKKKHSEQMMKVHMVKYYSISKVLNVIDERKKNNSGGKGPTKIMIPIIIINL
jgi:hypothetical protein